MTNRKRRDTVAVRTSRQIPAITVNAKSMFSPSNHASYLLVSDGERGLICVKRYETIEKGPEKRKKKKKSGEK